MQSQVEKAAIRVPGNSSSKSTRVKGRRNRPINPNNSLHRLGNKNTTGAHGEVTTWNVRVSHSRTLDPNADMQTAGRVVVTTGLPGKRKSAKRKRVSRMFPGKSTMLFHKHSTKQILNLRNDIHTVQMIGLCFGKQFINGDLAEAYQKINLHLMNTMSPAEKSAMDRADASRYHSIKGMVQRGEINSAAPIRNLNFRILKALSQMYTPEERKPTPHTFKPEPQNVYV